MTPSFCAKTFYLMLLSLGLACGDEAHPLEGEKQAQWSAESVDCDDAGADADALPDVSIGDVTMAGPDCRPGSFTIVYEEHANAQPGHRNFTAYPRPHQVESEATRPYAESECNFIVPVRIPAGWQYRLAQVDMRAEIDLKVGAEGEVDLTYGFMGQPATQLSNKKRMAGPMREASYAIPEAVSASASQTESGWSSCTDFRSLTLTTSLFLKSPVADLSAAAALDASTVSRIKLSQVGPLKLDMRRCPGAAAR